jgi:hypothetical protein
MCVGKVAEIRTYLDGYNNSNFMNAVDYAIKNNIYVIVNLVTHDGKTGHYPTDSEWINFVGQKVNDVISRGATKLNLRFTICNEPLKFMTREQYAHLINLAYQVINKRFSVGAGNEEFTLAESKGNMYEYILQNATFDILDIHIQTSCTSESDCIKWTNYAYQLGKAFNKPVDCTEANYVDVATQSGYNTLLMQLNNAERIGCPNFCMVFMNLDYSAFPFDVSKWNRLAFKVNNMLRSNYWQPYKDLMNEKAPVPNIEIEIEEDDMKLEILKIGSKGNQVRLLQEILMLEYGFPNNYADPFDGKFGNFTDQQVKDYQKAKGLTIDGQVGINTMTDLILGVDFRPVEERVFTTDYWMTKLEIYMAYK